MWHLAYRNLFQSKTRLALSVAGVALALTLVLALDAIFAGVEGQITAYIDRSGADVFVSQAGVRNMHMAASALPGEVVAEVRAVPGIAEAAPILYVTHLVTVGDQQRVAYIIGLPPGAAMGTPWRLAEGRAIPAPGEAVIDASVADKLGVGPGAPVTILGQAFTVVGLSEGTASLVSSIAFISASDFARLRGNLGAISYVLVRAAPGEDPATLAARIEGSVGGVTAQTRQAFADQERRVVRDMGTDVIAIMNLVGFLIGLAVLALTVYTATLARRAEYGVLKALGARNGDLYRAVLVQALGSVALGFAAGLTITLLLAAAVPRLGTNLALAVGAASLAKVGLASLASAGLAALLPIRQIAGLDPALVFKGGGAK